MPAFVASPLDPRVYQLLADAGFSDALFNPRQHWCCELVDEYVLQQTIAVVERLGVADLLREPRTADAILDASGFVPAFWTPLRWLLDRLVAARLATRDANGRYRLAAPLVRADLDPLRREGLEADPSYAPAFALVDEAAALYPAVARGETTGDAALLRRAGLWFAYFSNANGYYALTNRVTAHAAAARLVDSARVLEVGAGLGSATEAFVERLRECGTLGRLASYHVTEPVPLFRRRAERTVRAAHPDVPLAFGPLDMNAPWEEQDVAPGGADLVWGVNVFHLARDLDAALREAFVALAPGGTLVVGEGLRPRAGEPVGTEFPFQLLESYRDVRLDPRTRSTAGFLTAEEWLGALGRAGFTTLELVPDAIAIRRLYPAFLAGAVCGRRPPAA